MPIVAICMVDPLPVRAVDVSSTLAHRCLCRVGASIPSIPLDMVEVRPTNLSKEISTMTTATMALTELIDVWIFAIIVTALFGSRVLHCLMAEGPTQACMQDGMHRVLGVSFHAASLLLGIWAGPRIGLRTQRY